MKIDLKYNYVSYFCKKIQKMTRKNSNSDKEVDVVLIGAGIMSATLGMMLKELQPDITIEIFERLDVAAAESSDAWNNAGTGHSAFCELNYTPEKPDGSVDTKKAISIAESFEVSKQFWSFLVKNKLVGSPENFIKSIPHMSFVWGQDNVDFLMKRYTKLQESDLFKGMVYSENAAQLNEWMPLAHASASSEIAWLPSIPPVSPGADHDGSQPHCCCASSNACIYLPCILGCRIFVNGN